MLAVLYLVFIPAKMEFSDIKVTRDGKTENIELPYSVDMANGEEFIVSYNLLVKNKKTVEYKVIPDDCIQEIWINGENIPLEGIQGLCDYIRGVDFDFSEYIKEGLNHFKFRIKNNGSPGGFRVEVPFYNEFRSLSLIYHIFFLLFLFLILFTIKKMEVKLNQETIFACILAFPFVIYAFMELCLRIDYELTDVYTVDSLVYYAIGRGIVNGISPWSGLWDVKPLGIFLVSAISFRISDSSILTSYFQAFVLLITAVIPVITYFYLSNYRSVSKLAFSLLAGLLLALYSAERSGEFQVESFGAAFGCIAVFGMLMPNFEKGKILSTTLAIIGILGACGFKEPFLFPLLGVSLIAYRNIKCWLYRFALPLAIAILFGILILLICGWLFDFLHYLNFMFSTHIFRHGSPFRRAMEFSRIYDDMNAFSWGLAIAVLGLLSMPFFRSINSIKDEYNIFSKILLFGVAFFLTTYSVGVGGEFFNHHYVFALPFYMALVLLLQRDWNGEISVVAKLGFVSFIFLVIATLNLPDFQYDRRKRHLDDNRKPVVQAAIYLDSKMDELNIDRYTFIDEFNSNGPGIFGYTKHSPMGPYFLQASWWFNEVPGFGDSLISNIEKSDAVVVSKMWDQIASQAYQILTEQFTEQQMGRYKMYFRKNRMEQ
ncbi:MAG: hypothetical protein LBC75_09190 [Fibromonadaceae bacterium]|nr:hypothetical protein [Fibromonadaceae bacterium]